MNHLLLNKSSTPEEIEDLQRRLTRWHGHTEDLITLARTIERCIEEWHWDGAPMTEEGNSDVLERGVVHEIDTSLSTLESILLRIRRRIRAE